MLDGTCSVGSDDVAMYFLCWDLAWIVSWCLLGPLPCQCHSTFMTGILQVINSVAQHYNEHALEF